MFFSQEKQTFAVNHKNRSRFKSMKNSRLYKLLSETKSITDVIEEDFQEKDGFSLGTFVYDKLKYIYFEKTTTPLRITEIELSFKFEEVKNTSEIEILNAINEFNKKSVAIKTYISEFNREKGFISVDFNSALVTDDSVDIVNYIPLISVLSFQPERLSDFFRKAKIEHDYLDEE